MSSNVDAAIQQQPFRLLGVPAELRTMVSPKVLIKRKSRVHLDVRHFNKAKPALLRTCRIYVDGILGRVERIRMAIKKLTRLKLDGPVKDRVACAVACFL